MKIDDTILKAVKVTKQKIEKRFGINISEQEVIDIVDSQIRGTAFGFKKGVSVKLPVIGKFLFLDKKKTFEEIKKLEKLKDFYSEIEYNQKELEGKIATIKRNKDRWRREKLSKPSVVDLVKMPNISNGKILYDSLNAILKKDNNGE